MTTPNNTVAGLAEKLKNWRERLLKHTRYNGHRCEFRADCEAVAESMKAALASPALSAGVEVEAYQPQHGEPPSWFAEWFIAKLDTGERVVLRRLPEEYTYDYTTADATYYKAFRLKWWVQFPDSEFKQLESALQHPAAPSVSPAYDRELIARMLEDYRDKPGQRWADITVHEQIHLLRSADNAEAAGIRTVDRSPSVAGDLVERFKIAARAFIRERKVYGEDVETLGDVLRVLEAMVTPTSEPTEVEPAWQNIENAESEFLANLADKGGLGPLVAGMLRHCARLLDKSKATTEQPAKQGYSGGELQAQAGHGIEVDPARIDAYLTPEQPGSAVQGEAVAWRWRAGPHLWAYAGNEAHDWHPDEAEPLYTTPSPAADHIVDANKKVEARGVEGEQKLLALKPTAEMCTEGAKRLVRWEDNSKWPDSWSPAQRAAAINEAERVFRSMWLAATPNPVRAEQPEGKGADHWANVPKEYAGRWHYDYDESRRVFMVLASNRSSIAETEESEVADAICRAYNAMLAAAPSGVRVDDAARALVAKIEAIHADPRYQGVWVFAHNHGQPYTGPNYEAELAALTAALSANEVSRG